MSETRRETANEQSEHLALLVRLRGSYVSSSLTILSIIQGVALAALAAAVSANFSRFTPAQWVMALVTLGVLVVVWNQISIDTMSWSQIPNFQGALIPFLVGALELFQIAAISIGVTVWLFSSAVLIGFSSLGLAIGYRLAAREPENAALLARVRGMRRSAHAYNLVGIALSVLLAIGSLIGWFGTLDAAVSQRGTAATLAALAQGLWLAGWLWRSSWYWRKIVAYARTGK
jgi:hypothetical protein